MPVGDATVAGRELERVFGVDAKLDGMALEDHIALAQKEFFAGGDLDLLLHKVNARNHFGDGVLDLNAGVHFNEKELAVFVQKLKGASTAIIQIGRAHV